MSMFVSFMRVVKFGLQNVWRNFGLSITTITVLVLTLLSVNIFFAVNILTQHAVKTVNDQVDVSIHFQPDATYEEAQEVQEFVQTFNGVEAQLFTREQVLEEFRQQHVNDRTVIASLDELDENPFSEKLVVKSVDSGVYEEIIAGLDVPEYQDVIESESFNDHSVFIERINEITSRVEYIATGLTVIFGVIAFLIIFNAIRVAIYSQREEITITKLVGASNWFIRGPFLVGGLLYVLVSLGVTAAVVFGGLEFFDVNITPGLFNDGFVLKTQFLDQFWYVFGVQFGVVFVLVGLSSALAMRKHLRV